MSDLSWVTAIILAGGLGKRLRTVVSDRSKVLAEVDGKPFLYHLLDQLAGTGIGQVIISTGYLARSIEQVLGPSCRGLKLKYSREDTSLGTAGALKQAREIIDSPRCLVMNGDSFVEFDPISMLLFHIDMGAEITILVKKVDDTKRYGAIEMNAKHEIIRFKEKESARGLDLMNAGVYFMETSALEIIPDKTPCSLEYDFFPTMSGKGLYGCKTEGRFIDIGTPESYAQAEKFFG